MRTRHWVGAGAAEVLALILAFGLWAGGLVAAPGFASPNTQGDLAGVVAFEVAAAAVSLLVPGWLARRTRHPAWWIVGVVPALFALGTAVAVLAGW